MRLGVTPADRGHVRFATPSKPRRALGTLSCPGPGTRSPSYAGPRRADPRAAATLAAALPGAGRRYHAQLCGAYIAALVSRLSQRRAESAHPHLHGDRQCAGADPRAARAPPRDPSRASIGRGHGDLRDLARGRATRAWSDLSGDRAVTHSPSRPRATSQTRGSSLARRAYAARSWDPRPSL